MSSLPAYYCPRCGASLTDHAVEGLCARCLAGLYLATDTLPPDDYGEAPSAATSIEELAPLFPQLELLRFLGRGGMGVVYQVRQKSLGRLAALKLLAPERVANPKFAQRFVQEAQALAALNHPNIVTIYDFGQAGEFYYLLMEFVDGANLRQAMNARRFAPEQALAVVPPICEALQYAHDHGVVHRDVKPENLLLDKEGRVKIADFGVAKIFGSAFADVSAAESQLAGTPQYMAPEQLLQGATDHRADIYSLGVVLYEMLTGELPDHRLQPPSRRTQVDVGIDAVVLRALDKSPELRFSTATEFRTQVEALIQRSQGSATSPAPVVAAPAAAPLVAPHIEKPPARRIPRSLAVIAGLAALFGAIAIFYPPGVRTNRSETSNVRTGERRPEENASSSSSVLSPVIDAVKPDLANNAFEVRSGKVRSFSQPRANAPTSGDVTSTLRIYVPAGNYDLNPFRGVTAPRLLTKVSGDFEIRVQVTADFQPGRETTGKGNPFNGAGILIWQDDGNFLRIERNAWRVEESLFCYPPLMEYWHDREYSGVNGPAAPAEFFPGRSTWLKAARRDAKVTVSLSHDGTRWIDVKTFPVKLATELHVGVAALNTSNESLVVDFKDLTITQNGVESAVLFESESGAAGLAEIDGARDGVDRLRVRYRPTTKEIDGDAAHSGSPAKAP